MNNISIATRMLIIVIIPSLMIVLVILLLLSIIFINSIKVSELNQTHAVANSLARASEISLATGDKEMLAVLSSSAINIPSVSSISFSDSESEVYQLKKPGNDAKLSLLENTIGKLFFYDPAHESISIDIFRTELRDENELTAADITDIGKRDSKPIGKVTLKMEYSYLGARFADWLYRAFIMMLPVFIMAVALSWLLSRGVTQPILRLTKSVRALSSNQYPDIQDQEKGGELGALARGFAAMSEKLQSFHRKLQSEIDSATHDLKQTLTQLEERNAELEVARSTAERANQFKSEFLAVMSHEIRSPMNSIIGNLSLMSESDLPFDQKRRLHLINQSSEILLSLVDELLDLSRIEAGQMALDEVPTDLLLILEEIGMSVSHLTQIKNLNFHIDTVVLPEARFIVADPIRLKQILFNLTGNAIKFTDEGHVALFVECSIEDSNICNPELMLTFTVEDTGMGISSQDIDRLFDAFIQLDMSSTRKYQGSGLGLHICSRLVNLMNGEISVDSVVGEGSSFRVTLKFKTYTPAKSPNPIDRVDSLPPIRFFDPYTPLEKHRRRALTQIGLTVLGIDDEPENCSYPLLVSFTDNTSYLDGDSGGIIFPDEVANYVNKYALIVAPDYMNNRLVSDGGFRGFIHLSPNPQNVVDGLYTALYAVGDKRVRDEQATRVEQYEEFENLNILAIDDQQVNLELLDKFFDLMGVNIDLAISAADGLHLCSTHSYDLILLDLHMPNKDGFETAHTIRTTIASNKNTLIIALTADAFASTRNRALGNYFDGFMSKPVTYQDIKSLLLWYVNSASREGTINAFEKPNWTKSYPAINTNSHLSHCSTAPLVCLERCASQVKGDMKWAKKALSGYSDSIPGYIVALNTAIAERDRDGLLTIAHSVKGVSYVCGVVQIAESMESIECKAKEGNWILLQRMISDAELLLLAAMEDTQQALASNSWPNG